MTSRERVQKAVNFQEPDRVPIDLGGMKASGIAAAAYARLKKLAGPRRPDPGAGPALHDRRGRGTGPAALPRRRAPGGPLRHRVRRTSRSGLGSACGLRRDAPAVPARHRHPRRTPTAAGSCWTPTAWTTSFRMPKGGYYFDDTAFNRGGRIDPAKFRPQADIPDESLRLLSDYTARSAPRHGVRPAGLGLRRLLPGPEPDHRPLQQRDPGACPTSG